MPTEGSSPGKAMSKTDVLNYLAEKTGLTKKQVAQLFDELSSLIGQNLRDGGPGVFSIPNLLKIKVQRKPATPEREGINPFTKEEQWFAAKPASVKVKVRPLKNLKDAAA